MGRIIPIILSVFLAAVGGASAAPGRVVSINLCTDYLAYIMAAPGQLISISFLSTDPLSSFLVETAEEIGINHATAEEVLRLKPDLVLAGTYTSRNTVHLLRRLGVTVVEFDPAFSLAAVRRNILKMGDTLGRSEKAATLLQRFDQQIADVLQNRPDPDHNPVISTYSSDAYVAGAGSLESDMIRTAGFRHLGSEMETAPGGKVSIEKMILENPDYLIEWNDRYQDQARATEIVRHPALRKWFTAERRIKMDQRYWSCGTPKIIEAIEQLATFRRQIGEGAK